jgi:MFS family permease
LATTGSTQEPGDTGTRDPAAEAARLRLVVGASVAGTTFEWYDFFLFVPLASIIARTFFAGLDGAMAYVVALGAFAAGFAFRPLGALAFGAMGDRIGRKSTFLVTIVMMGVATFAVGLLPTYAQAGLWAPALFVLLRIIQGLALGGEWGGAAVYIAEHAPHGKRGLLTSWMGAAAAFGLGAALIVTLATRLVVGEEAFAEWGWRIPFLLSGLLFGLSVWVRMKLHESPMFEKLRDSGGRSKAPLAESFGQWRYLRIVLIALFTMMIAQGAVWYTTFFYSQFFLERVLKVAPETVNLLMIALVAVSAPLYLLAGWLSDRIGRKPVMLSGIVLATLAFYPVFHTLASAANPALVEAAAREPVRLVADPADCTLQFDPVGKKVYSSSCDIAAGALAAAGVPYTREAGAPGSLAVIHIGSAQVPAASGSGLPPAELKALKAGLTAPVAAALAAAGYPQAAAPERTDAVQVFLVLMVLVVAATALYGPQAACLVELFPTRIRYTALSLPYHIGTGWVGGFLPATAYAMSVATGDIYFGLWYPVAFSALAAVVMLLWLPETRNRRLEDDH